MPHIHFTSNLQRHVSCPSVTVPGDTVATALGAVFGDNPALRSYLLDDQGRLRRHVNVFINGSPVQDRARLSDALNGNDEVFVIQALSGG